MLGDRFEPKKLSSGPLQRLDARIKLLVALGLVVTVVLMPIGRWRPLALAALFLSFLSGLAGLSLSSWLRRWLPVLPTVVLLALLVAPAHPQRPEFGLGVVALTIVAKNALAIGTMLVLTAVTPASDLLNALVRLRMPTVLVSTLHLMYRYMFVLADQLGRMTRARRSRSFRRSRWLDWPLNSGLIAALLLRSLERGERVHAAMLARGWDGVPRRLDEP